jgi:hypothetical protein
MAMAMAGLADRYPAGWGLENGSSVEGPAPQIVEVSVIIPFVFHKRTVSGLFVATMRIGW